MDRTTIMRERVKAVIACSDLLTHFLPITARSEWDSARKLSKVYLTFANGNSLGLLFPEQPEPTVIANIWIDNAAPGVGKPDSRKLLPNPLVDKIGFASALLGISGFGGATGNWAAVHGAVPLCPKCGRSPMEMRTPDRGEPFWSCCLYPTCQGTIDTFTRESAEAGRYCAPKCPTCASPMRARRRGDGKKFWSCTDYPRCSRTLPHHLGRDGLTAVSDWMPATTKSTEDSESIAGAAEVNPRFTEFDPDPLEIIGDDIGNSMRKSTPRPPATSPQHNGTVDDIRSFFRARRSVAWS